MGIKKLFIILLILLIPSVLIAFPSGQYRTLTENNKKTKENSIENPRTKSSAQRKASENKYPWKNNSFLDMEGYAWSSFSTGRPEIPISIDSGDPVKKPKANLGCAFYSPNIISGNRCNNTYYQMHMALLTGVVTNWSSSGPASVSWNGDMVWKISKYQNAAYGSEVLVSVTSKSLEDGSESICYGSATILCEEQCECIGVYPTIYASSSTISAGGSITLYVDSGGLACPPYSWSVSGTGYSLNKSETDEDLENITLSADTGTCGTEYDATVTITVTDNCGLEETLVIRNAAGNWGTRNYDCDATAGGTEVSNIVGNEIMYSVRYSSVSSNYCGTSDPSCPDPNDIVDCGEYLYTGNYSFAYTDLGIVETRYDPFGAECDFCKNQTSSSGTRVRIGRAYYQYWECP